MFLSGDIISRAKIRLANGAKICLMSSVAARKFPTAAARMNQIEHPVLLLSKDPQVAEMLRDACASMA